MKCSQCHFENSPNARFCHHCGAPLVPEQAAPPPAPSVQPVADNLPVAVQNAGKADGTNAVSKKAKHKARLFLFLQLLVYLLIAAGTVWFVFFEKGVRMQAAFHDDTFREFSFFGILTNLITGGEKYNPTALSIVMGVSAILLTFSSALFWIVAFVTKAIKKFDKESHLLAVSFTVLHVGATCSLLPLATRFSGVLKQLCAKEANILVSDVGSIDSVWAFVFAGIVLLLVVAELIFAAKEKKCRTQYEKGC